MANTTQYARICLRQGNNTYCENFNGDGTTRSNTLMSGEPIFNTETSVLKIGDGKTPYKDLKGYYVGGNVSKVEYNDSANKLIITQADNSTQEVTIGDIETLEDQITTINQSLSKKYEKPSNGIPEDHLTNNLQTKINNAVSSVSFADGKLTINNDETKSVNINDFGVADIKTTEQIIVGKDPKILTGETITVYSSDGAQLDSLNLNVIATADSSRDLTIRQASENLFNKKLKFYSYTLLNSDGVVQRHETYCCSDFYKVEPNTNYLFENFTSSGTAVTIAFFDENKGIIKYNPDEKDVRYNPGINTNPDFTTPSECAYIRFNLNKGKCDIPEGVSDDDEEPTEVYIKSTLNIFPAIRKYLDQDIEISDIGVYPLNISNLYSSYNIFSILDSEGVTAILEAKMELKYLKTIVSGSGILGNKQTGKDWDDGVIEASGAYSFAQGYGYRSKSNKDRPASWGKHRALGNYSHVEGANNTAGASCSHAEGFRTHALGQNSHTEGVWTLVSKTQGVEEGLPEEQMYDIDSGWGSGLGEIDVTGGHAEGLYTEVRSSYGHAEGNSSIVLHTGAHTEGLWTKSSANYQHVSGQYNTDNENALLIIGNGADEEGRSNALEVLKDGRVTIGADPKEDMDIVTKQYLNKQLLITNEINTSLSHYNNNIDHITISVRPDTTWGNIIRDARFNPLIDITIDGETKFMRLFKQEGNFIFALSGYGLNDEGDEIDQFGYQQLRALSVEGSDSIENDEDVTVFDILYPSNRAWYSSNPNE